jgi:hypothetical protein
VYFISEVLSESKVCYLTIQKLLYGILITSRKLHHYFDAYNILVVSDFPLADMLHNRDATGRISKWAVELGALTLDFKPWTAIKSQVSHPIYKDINRAIIYAPGSSHAYIQQNYQDITTHIMK